MSVDVHIRSRITSLATAAHDDAASALVDVLRAGSARRRRAMFGRVAFAATLTVAAIGVGMFAWDGGGSTADERPPVHDVDRLERSNPVDDRVPVPDREEGVQEDASAPQRSDDLEPSGPGPGRVGDRARDEEKTSRIGGGSIPEGEDDPGREASGAGSDTESRPPESQPSENDGAAGDDDGSGLTVSRRPTRHYEMPLVRPRIDSRNSCTAFGEGCVRFETRPTDRFAQVTVEDDAATSVPVRITQWDRYGRVVAGPLTLCGGTSEVFEVVGSAEHIIVEIEEGRCGDGADATGGRVGAVFFE